MIPSRVLTTIMRHEWRVLGRSRIWQSTLILFIAFSALAVYNGVIWAQAQRESFRVKNREQMQLISAFKSEQARYEQTLLNGSTAKPPSASVLLSLGLKGVKAILPLSPLAALSAGQADLYPIAATVNMHNHRSDLFVESEQPGPFSLLSGRFDLAFVLLYVYPLLIMAASYNLLSSEREGGMLAATLVQPISLWCIVFGKVALRAAFFCGLAVLCCTAAIVLTGADLASYEVRLRVILWASVIVLYGVWWLAVCLAVNALGKSSIANAALLAGAWAFFLLVVPGIIGMAVSNTHPVPSRLEISQAGRRAGSRAEAAGRPLIGRYYAEHPEFASGASARTFSDDARMYYAVHAEVERDIGPLIDRFNQQLTSQQRLMSWSRFTSPVIVTQEAMDDLAGTGISRFALFRTQAAAFHSEWQSFFISKIFLGTRMTLADYDAHPGFVFHDESVQSAAGRVLAGLAGLSLAVLLTGALAVVALRKYPILPA